MKKAIFDQYVQTTEEVQNNGFMDIIVNIVPSNIIQSMADGDMLAIIFFSVLFGLGVAAIGKRGKPVLAFFQGTADAMFWVTNLIMKFAPFGVFALIGVTVSKFGLESLIPLGKLLILVYATMIFFIVVVLGGIAKMCGYKYFSTDQSIERRTNISVFHVKFRNGITKSDGENGEIRMSERHCILCHSNRLFI